jgi:hypothetical protein
LTPENYHAQLVSTKLADVKDSIIEIIQSFKAEALQ